MVRIASKSSKSSSDSTPSRITDAPVSGLLIDVVGDACIRAAANRGWSVEGAAAVPIQAGARLARVLARPPRMEELLEREQVLFPFKRRLDG